MNVMLLKKGWVAALLLMIMPFTTHAQDKVEASVGADLVSGYIWRGQDLGGVSLQPSFGISYKGFSIEAWGSVGVNSKDAKELDLTIGYEVGGFSICINDYWASGDIGYFHYKANNTSHVFEAQLGYDFGPVAINWNTIFAGADGVNKKGNRAYSSYFSVKAPFTLGSIDWEAEVGAVPWATDYYNDGTNGFAVCDVSLSASKEIKVTESFALPLFAKVTWNPCTDAAYFVVGLTF